MLATSIFSFSNTVLYPFKDKSYYFSHIKFVACPGFELGHPPKLWFGKELTLSQTSPGVYMSAVQVFWKHCGKKRNCSTRLENSLPFSSNLKLSSATSFSLEESKICCMGKGWAKAPNANANTWQWCMICSQNFKLKLQNSRLCQWVEMVWGQQNIWDINTVIHLCKDILYGWLPGFSPFSTVGFFFKSFTKTLG